MPRLIPRDEAFQEIFIKDGENLLEAARALNEMFTEFDRLDERVATIQALEHTGDEIDIEIAARLERSFITPVRPRGHPRARTPAWTTWWTGSRRPPRRS